MVHTRSLGIVLLLAGLLAALPLRADERLGDPAGNAITAFEVAPGDAAKLAWLQRWSEHLTDLQERFAALSDGWSASEQAALANGPGELAEPRGDEPGAGFETPHGHLAQVHLLAELRLRGEASGADWQARHLCNAVRLGREWLVSSAGCVTLEAELAGLEARVEATDLAAAGGTVAAVDRIVRQSDGKLVLLHLSGERALPDPGPLYWLSTRVPNQPRSRSHLLSWGRPKPLPGLPATLFRHIELEAARGAVCDRQAAGGGNSCLVQAGVRLCPGDEGGPVYFVAEDGTVSLQGMVALDERKCFVSTRQALRPAPVIDLNRHRAWIEAVIAPVDGEGS